MYPNLTPALLVLLGVAVVAAAYVGLRWPFLRHLSLRQVGRRRREALLVVLGSMLGTAIVVGSLIVGDTLNFSVKQAAYQHLGPIDETVTSSTLYHGREVTARLAGLRGDPGIDGMLGAYGDVTAAAEGTGAARVAEPRVGVWDIDLARAATFGGTGVSGMSGPNPKIGRASCRERVSSVV